MQVRLSGIGDGLESAVGAVMPRNPWAGVFGVVDGIDDQLFAGIVSDHSPCTPELS